MRAILLNPPRRVRRNKKVTRVYDSATGQMVTKGASAPTVAVSGAAKRTRRRRKLVLGKRPILGSGCRRAVSRLSRWKKVKKQASRRAAAAAAAARRRSAKKSAAVSLESQLGPLASTLPSSVTGVAANPRRRKNTSTWIPEFCSYLDFTEKNPKRVKRAKKRNTSTWIPAFGRDEDLEVSENPRKRRKNASFDYGTAFSRKNPYWVPGYASNPMSLSALTGGFKPSVLLGVLPYAGGMVGNAYLSTLVKKFMPSLLSSGIGGAVVELGTAGLLGAGVGMVAPGQATPVFLGGVIETVLSAINSYLKPYIPGLRGCCGMGDYLSPANAASALPLGDYATTSDARAALPLGSFGGGNTAAQYYSLPGLPPGVGQDSITPEDLDGGIDI